MKLPSLEITLPDGRKFIADAEVEYSFKIKEHMVPTPFGSGSIVEPLSDKKITSVEILTLHQLVEIGDENTLRAVEAQIEKDLA